MHEFSMVSQNIGDQYVYVIFYIDENISPVCGANIHKHVQIFTCLFENLHAHAHQHMHTKSYTLVNLSIELTNRPRTN